ncbi:MAG: transmembrane anchor protein [Halopseudomonas sp.]
MYNSDLPNRAQLPTSRQLLRSTLIAAVVAALLLITTVLPAEYGIDPTGAGRYLGLTNMGEIKLSLAQESTQQVTGQKAAATQAGAVSKEDSVAVPLISPASAEVAQTAVVAKPVVPALNVLLASDQKVITLMPGEATEIKLAMSKGATVAYEWAVEGGAVNFDTHGDSPTLNYYGYGKGRQATGDSGVLEAAFDGKHGWYWRNRSAAAVTITLNTEGEYQSIQRMM